MSVNVGKSVMQAFAAEKEADMKAATPSSYGALYDTTIMWCLLYWRRRLYLLPDGGMQAATTGALHGEGVTLP